MTRRMFYFGSYRLGGELPKTVQSFLLAISGFMVIGWLESRGLPGLPIRSPAAFVVAALTPCYLTMSRTNAGDIWSCGSDERYTSLDDKSMWMCLAAGCTGGPFAGQNETKARFHAAQVKGGCTKVCDGVPGEQLSDALVTD